VSGSGAAAGGTEPDFRERSEQSETVSAVPARPPARFAGPRGLRPRLVLAFALVASSSALAALVLGYLAGGYLRYWAHRYGDEGGQLGDWILYRFPDPEQLTGARLAVIGVVIALAILVLTAALALLAAHRVLRPVRRLAAAAHRLADGELHTRLEVQGADELADLVRSFNSMAVALELTVEDLRGMEAQARRFAADVSHELRTPLASMTAVTDLLDAHGEKLEGDSGAAARLVSAEIRNLNRLVADLIEISRIEAGTATLVLDEVDLGAAVGDTLRRRGWDEQVQADLPDGVVGTVDTRRLDLIVANLVGNALRHGAPPVTVTLCTEQADGRDLLTLRVEDRGPGLDPASLPHVFERFYKSDSARGRSEGSGLGLSIAWENAKLHGGTIEAANRPDGGARFALRLPATPGGAA
jgi:two-component system, OmpR family, sensor histidine kinase MtrB